MLMKFSTDSVISGVDMYHDVIFAFFIFCTAEQCTVAEQKQLNC